MRVRSYREGVGRGRDGQELQALTSGGVVGHAERGDAVGALGVEDVAVLRVGDVAVGAAVGEALEDLARDGARVGGRRAVLRQHHRATRHQRVQDRHLPPCSLRAGSSPPPVASSAVWTRGRTEEGENFRKGERGGGQVGLGWAEMETEDTPSWLPLCLQPAYWVRSGDGDGDGRLV